MPRLERIYRDSVHDIIRLNTGTGEGRLIVALIDTPEFQRLRRFTYYSVGNAVRNLDTSAPQYESALTLNGR